MPFKYQPLWQGPLPGRSFEKQTEDFLNGMEERVNEIDTRQTPSDAVPMPPGAGAAGTSGEYSRGDHSHPLQSSVSGTAGSLETARTISMSGEGSGSAAFDGSADVSIPLAVSCTASGTTEDRAIADRFADCVNARDFGLQADGSPNDPASVAALSSFMAASDSRPAILSEGLYAAEDGSAGILVSGSTILRGLNVDGHARQYRNTAGICHYLKNETAYAGAYLNGGCCDSDYLYIAITKSDGTEQLLQKISLATGVLVLQKPQTGLGHCNTMTCDDSYVYVSGSSDIYKLSKTTLDIVSVIDISDSAVYVTGLAYDAKTERFFGRNGSGQNYFFIYDKDFNYIAKTPCLTHPKGLSSQDICFCNGELYGFVFGSDPTQTGEYLNYLVRYDHNGAYSQVWALGLCREVENLCLCGDRLMVGVNTVYGSRYDFYQLELATDEVSSTSEFDFARRKIEGVGNYPSRGLKLYVAKDATGSMLVGDGSQGNPFHSINEAVFVATKAAKENFNLHQISLLIKGDFSDEYITLDNIPITVFFSSQGESYAVGPVKINNCNDVRFVNQDCKISLSDSIPSSVTDYALEINSSSVYCSVPIENTRSDITSSYGVYSTNSFLTFGNLTVSISSFDVGFYISNSEVLIRGAVSFSSCNTNVQSYYSRTITAEDSSNASGYLLGDSKTAYLPYGISTKALFLYNGSFPQSRCALEYKGSTSYNGVYLQAQYNGANGASLTLRPTGGTYDAGMFIVRADSGSGYKTLEGRPDGTLTWDGQSIQTASDVRLKRDIGSVQDAVLDAWGDVCWEAYRYRDAVDEKGDRARLHVGLVAQHVLEAFANRGLDACALGIVCHDEWADQYEDVTVVDQAAVYDADGVLVTPEQSHVEQRLVKGAGDLWTVRYTEALAMECAYQRRINSQLRDELERLKASIARYGGESES